MKVYGRYIYAYPGVNGGRACIQGKMISCSVILSRLLAGETVEELAEDYGTSGAHIEAVKRYVFSLLERELA